MGHLKYKNLPVLVSGHNPAVAKRTWVKKGEIPHVIQVAHAIFPLGEECSLHIHDDMHELFLVE
jgi:hypothetical protein